MQETWLVVDADTHGLRFIVLLEQVSHDKQGEEPVVAL